MSLRPKKRERRKKSEGERKAAAMASIGTAKDIDVQFRKSVRWLGIDIFAVTDPPKRHAHGNIDYDRVGMYPTKKEALMAIHEFREDDPTRSFQAMGWKGQFVLYANSRIQDTPMVVGKQYAKTREYDGDKFTLVDAYHMREDYMRAREKIPYPQYEWRVDQQDDNYLLYKRKRRKNEVRAMEMEYDQKMKTLRKWLKKHCKSLNIRRGRGTAYSWLNITGTGERKGFKTEDGWPKKFTPEEEKALTKMGLTYGYGETLRPRDTIAPEDHKWRVEQALDSLEG